MDIFTTVLTRVVPVPIKPTSLKVKALLKDAGAGKLKEDLDHLENHDYYFGEKNSDKEQQNAKENEQANSTLTGKEDEDNSDSVVTESSDGVKHLDLYV
ncbi:MAG: hypothetical protein COB83_11940 [Gammaproteobacteria bacterium]|nr:MAG: hypothetical protein COB83_11940 [Gammaproteobacteria bacterium]